MIRASGYLASKEKSFDVSSAPLPDERIPCIQRPVTQGIKSMNTVERGSMTLAAAISDTHIGRGDNIKLSLAFRNNSSAEIQRFEVKLVEVVAGDTKAAKDGEFGKDSNAKEDLYVKKSAKIQGSKSRLEFLCKGSAESRDESSNADAQLRSIYRELFDNEFTFEFTCPDTARDSYAGRLLHVRHYVKVKMMTNAVTDNPLVTIPLKIGNPPFRRSRQSRARSPASSPHRRRSPADSSNPTRSRPSRTGLASHGLPMPSPIALASLQVLAPPVPVAVQDLENRSDLRFTQSVPNLPSITPMTISTEQPVHQVEPPTVRPTRIAPTAHPPPSAPMAQPYFREPRTTLASQSVPQLPPSAPVEVSSPQTVYRAIPSSGMTQSVPNLPPSAPLSEVIATPLPFDTCDNSATYGDTDAFVVLGGDAIFLPEEDPDTNDFFNNTPTRLLPPAYAPSLGNLYEEMLTSVEDFEIIQRKLLDDGWKSLLQQISPDEFGAIIGHINMDFNQPRIAILLAPLLNGGENFTCEYCAAAVRSTAAWNRSTMVENLVDFVVDLAINKHLILAELSHWDQIITEQCINESLSRRIM